MRTSRYILIAVGLLIGLSNTALARPKVSIGFSIGGRPGLRASYRTGGRRGSYKTSHNYRHRKPNWGRRAHRPRRKTIILGGGCWYDSRPNYCVVTSPVVVERRTVVVSTVSPQVVQSQQFDESTLQRNMDLQYKKSELLNQLQAPNKELRRQAIKELAGFSFDDNVRAALENILLSDSDPELRAEAARSFGAVKNANARAALEKARVEDPDADVRRAADEAIKSIMDN